MERQWFGDTFVSVTKEERVVGQQALHRPGHTAPRPVDERADAVGLGRHEVLELRNYGAFLMPWLDDRAR